MHEGEHLTALVNAAPSRPRRPKLTAERLTRVEALQRTLAGAADEAQEIANEELNGWTPGSPVGGRSPRVEPLEKLARDLTDAVEALEALYS